MNEDLKELGAHIELRRPDCVLGWSVEHGELTVEVTPTTLPEFVEFLKADGTCRFSTLVDITGIDHPER